MNISATEAGVWATIVVALAVLAAVAIAHDSERPIHCAGELSSDPLRVTWDLQSRWMLDCCLRDCPEPPDEGDAGWCAH